MTVVNTAPSAHGTLLGGLSPWWVGAKGMRGIESANLLLSRAVCGLSNGVFGRSVDAGAVAGRAARAWPRVLYGAVLGLSCTGDGASFNAASASTAADVRWKKLTGILGAAFSCKLALDLQSLALGDGAGPSRPARSGLVEGCLDGRWDFGGLAAALEFCS